MVTSAASPSAAQGGLQEPLNAAPDPQPGDFFDAVKFTTWVLQGLPKPVTVNCVETSHLVMDCTGQYPGKEVWMHRYIIQPDGFHINPVGTGPLVDGVVNN